MIFNPVATLADLLTLDEGEIMRGYMEFSADDPEPGANRGRAYWHGWCNAARDLGLLPQDNASRQLAREYVVDTSDIPEAGEDFFKKAKLLLPEDKRKSDE